MKLEQLSRQELLLKVIALQSENEQLRVENIKLGERILYVIEQVLPTAYEIIEAKGIFKVFVVFKLAIKLVDAIIKEFSRVE